MTENEIAKIIVDLCVKIHKILGPGLLESASEAALVHELRSWAYISNVRLKYRLYMTA